MDAAWIVTLVVGLAAPLFTYLAVIRRASGRIATTEAAKLWDEAGDLRKVYREEIDRLRHRIDGLATRVARLEEEKLTLEEENERLKHRVSELESEVHTLHAENLALKASLEEVERHGGRR